MSKLRFTVCGDFSFDLVVELRVCVVVELLRFVGRLAFREAELSIWPDFHSVGSFCYVAILGSEFC